MRVRLILLVSVVALLPLTWFALSSGAVDGEPSTKMTTAPVAVVHAASRIDKEEAAETKIASDAIDAPTSVSATTTSAVANADAADASPAPGSRSSGSRLAALERGARLGDRKAARDWAEAVMECGAAIYGEEINKKPTHVSHLGWNLVEQRFELRVAMLGSLLEECRHVFPELDEERAMQHWRSMVREAIALWAGSGDPYGQLLDALARGAWPPTLDQWREQQAMAVAHLNPGDPQTLVDVSEAFAEGSRFMSDAWILAACDLGYDCAPGGALQRRMCLSRMACFEGSYEEMALRQMSPRQWATVQRQRQVLIEMLQRGEIAATFDVPPPGP